MGSHLDEVAKLLNEQTDELVKQVAIIEKGLSRLGLGLSAWVDGKSAEYELGYGKLRQRWGFLVRERKDHSQLWPFADAPRPARIECVDQIPALLEALDSASHRMLVRLNEARNKAKSFAAAAVNDNPTS